MVGDVAAARLPASETTGQRGTPLGLRRLPRRGVLRLAGAFGLASPPLRAWAASETPGPRLRVVRHALRPTAWPDDFPLRVAILADPHVGGLQRPLERLVRAVVRCNALAPDLVVLLGDYLADHRFAGDRPGFRDVAEVLAKARAPLGVHAVLGNHDWWECDAAQAGRRALPGAAEDFAAAGLPILHNAARRLHHAGRPFWLAGLGSQWAYRGKRGRILGADDLNTTLAALTDAAPAILLAHEPDIFPYVPDRFAVTLSGHTHGGQVRLGNYSPLVPSRFGNRYAYGAIEEAGQHLVVSGGLGNSLLPVRLGLPPEITLVELGGAATA